MTFDQISTAIKARVSTGVFDAVNTLSLSRLMALIPLLGDWVLEPQNANWFQVGARVARLLSSNRTFAQKIASSDDYPVYVRLIAAQHAEVAGAVVDDLFKRYGSMAQLREYHARDSCDHMLSLLLELMMVCSRLARGTGEGAWRCAAFANAYANASPADRAFVAECFATRGRSDFPRIFRVNADRLRSAGVNGGWSLIPVDCGF